MISCDQASTICNKVQYKEATFIEKLKLRFHLFLCKTCAAFTVKNSRFTSLCEKANLRSLSEKEKIQMKEELSKNL